MSRKMKDLTDIELMQVLYDRGLECRYCSESLVCNHCPWNCYEGEPVESYCIVFEKQCAEYILESAREDEDFMEELVNEDSR